MLNTTLVEHYQKLFQNNNQDLKNPALFNLRKQALLNLEKIGFPSPRDEVWKYTRTRLLAEKIYSLPEKIELNFEIVKPYILDETATTLVFVNGIFSQTLSLNINHENLMIKPILDCLIEQPELLSRRDVSHRYPNLDAFDYLNQAFANQGAYIEIKNNAHIEKPIQMIYLSKDLSSSTYQGLRNYLRVNENSHAKLIETYVVLEDNQHLDNIIFDIALEKNAKLMHQQTINEDARAFCVARYLVTQKENSYYQHGVIANQALILRNEIQCLLLEEHAECKLYGLMQPNGNSHVDLQVRVDHVAEHCKSEVLYKGIFPDQTRGVFNGKIRVHENAQKTSAHLVNHNLLLSNLAEIDTKPELEIDADDVQCSHGVTVGQLDETALFYLRSRGINEIDAKEMLLKAFADQVLEKMQLC